MAPLPKSLPLFFLITLLFSGQTIARESRFFSKTTRESTETTKPAATVNVESSKEEEEEPAFLPQTSDNAPYGLYGRQTDLDFSPSTTTKYNQQTYQPRKEEPAFDNNKNTKYFNNMETFETKEEEDPTPSTTTTTEPEFYNSGHRKNYASELQGLDGYAKRNAYGGYYIGERQGMSDTRFMANGKYFYDVNSERPAAYNYGGAYQSKAGRAAEYYNNDGYYSGSTESFNKYYKNTRPGFRGGEQSLQEEEEFDFDP